MSASRFRGISVDSADSYTGLTISVASATSSSNTAVSMSPMTGDAMQSSSVRSSRNRTASADSLSPSKLRAHGSFFTKNLGPEFMKVSLPQPQLN